MNTSYYHSARYVLTKILEENAAALERYLRKHAESLTLEEIENLRKRHAETRSYLLRSNI
jgi:hypothetical protein